MQNTYCGSALKHCRAGGCNGSQRWPRSQHAHGSCWPMSRLQCSTVLVLLQSCRSSPSSPAVRVRWSWLNTVSTNLLTELDYRSAPWSSTRAAYTLMGQPTTCSTHTPNSSKPTAFGTRVWQCQHLAPDPPCR